jgi:cell division septum initiation protein DivIVA
MISENLSIESQFREDGSLTSPNHLTDRLTDRAEFYMNLHRELDKLEEMLLESGPRVAGRTMINEEKICRQIDQVRVSIPESIARAEEILQYKQEIIAEAENYAEEVEANTQMRAAKMLEESVILRQAELEAGQLRRRVQEECDELRMQTLNEINQMRRQAQKEWDTLRQQVNTEAEEMQRGADNYSDRILGNLEGQLFEMLKIVQNGRKELRP